MLASGPSTVVLVGFESVGKTALFRGLSGARTGDEANFRGSTVVCRRCQLSDCHCELVDTPGIRMRSDSATTALALDAMGAADTVLVVLRATDLERDARTFLREVAIGRRRLAVVVTFADKVAGDPGPAVDALRTRLGVPVVALNAREMGPQRREAVLQAIQAAQPVRPEALAEPSLVRLRVRPAERTVFESPVMGPVAALATMLALLALPVALAYQLASWLQAPLDAHVIEPATAAFSGTWPPLAALLVGPYGLLTLGAYSFLWAFPVVLLIGLSSSLAEETGLHDRITAALDPALRHIGLSGRDLVPVLTGFGCNVVAVLHSRSCSSCSRKACVSLIGFGSACSYQIGASLSLFGTAGRAWMFGPYLLTLFIVGALHTRLWHGRLESDRAVSQAPSYLQRPTLRAVLWRSRGVVKQFLVQAMPVFLALCVLSAALDQLGLLTALSRAFGPLMQAFNLPDSASMAMVSSALRKDGMLLLNASGGALLASMTAGQVFVAVYLAGTLTPCLVTLAAIHKELGLGAAARLLARQATTAVGSAWLLSRFVG